LIVHIKQYFTGRIRIIPHHKLTEGIIPRFVKLFRLTEDVVVEITFEGNITGTIDSFSKKNKVAVFKKNIYDDGTATESPFGMLNTIVDISPLKLLKFCTFSSFIYILYSLKSCPILRKRLVYNI
jgi:hypothetical protein